MSEPQTHMIKCRTYTYARRYPLVVGKIGGAVLWWPLTVTQLATFCICLTAAHLSRFVWATSSPTTNIAIGVGLPAAAAWAMRHLRLEGRSPLSTLLGLLTVLAAPEAGRVHGRAHRSSRPTRTAQRVWIMGGR